MVPNIFKIGIPTGQPSRAPDSHPSSRPTSSRPSHLPSSSTPSTYPTSSRPSLFPTSAMYVNKPSLLTYYFHKSIYFD